MKTVSFDEAVRLFKYWGFRVELGPRPEEVTVILDGEDYCTHVVYEAALLPQIATTILRTRMENGVVFSSAVSRAGQAAPVLAAGAAALLRK